MSVSYKWAEQGVFGSDIFSGFFNADRHYFINLPLHHVLQAAMFRLFGTGIGQARAVSLVMAVLLLWLVGGLAYRWYGLATGILTAFLLVFWRSGLVGTGIPLLKVGTSGRYDIGAVLWIWVAIGLYVRQRERPSPAIAFLVGMGCALASLTQFFAAFTVPLVALLWINHRRRAVTHDPLTYWMTAGFGLALLPYAFMVVRHWPDFMGQGFIHASRTNFADISFYWHNLLGEPKRYAALLTQPDNPAFGYKPMTHWLLLIGICPAIWNLLRRRGQKQHHADHLLLATLLVFGGCLALLDTTKAPLYAVVLMPSICMAFARLGTDSVAWIQNRPRFKRGGTILAVLILSIVLFEGAGSYIMKAWRAGKVSSYSAVGARIDSQLPRGAAVIGLERWWWALQPDHSYLSWSNVWQQWRYANRNDPETTTLADIIAASPAEFLLISSIDRVYIQSYPRPLQDQFETLVTECSLPAGEWTDPTYGYLHLRRLLRYDSGLLHCNAENG